MPEKKNMLHANRACGSTWRKPRGDWREKKAGSTFHHAACGLCVFGVFGFWFCNDIALTKIGESNQATREKRTITKLAIQDL